MDRNGGLKEAVEAPELPIGMRIYAFGAGMSDQLYCVTSKRDSRGLQKVVLTSNFYEDAYFAPEGTIDKHIRGISEKFGIGKYWDDINNYIYPMDEVLEFITRADELTQQIKKKQEEKAAADNKEIQELPARFPHLTPTDGYNYKVFRANIIADLKHNFPDYKFSIQKHSSDSISINWENGLSVNTVNNVLLKYNNHEFDHSGDYYDYTPSNFNRVFGGMKFIRANRNMSDSISVLKDKIHTIFTDHDTYECGNLLYRVFCRTDFPVVATNFDIKRNDIKCGTREEVLDITFDSPSNKATPVPCDIAADSADLRLEIYNEKSFAVYGKDTKTYKDKLSDLGGAFNSHLKGGPGYIFSKKRLSGVQDFLGSFKNI